ncbi:MAG TPA: response regulator, partial [Acidimicrobiales bacterium]|nr:response regulator [Acidimicrobiales bacterium]
NGREALARVAELGPEAILLDLHMPVLDGRRALPLLRTAAPAAAIVVLSAGEIGAVRLCELRALGADAAVEKGVSLGELRQAVVSAVADRRTTTA